MAGKTTMMTTLARWLQENKLAAVSNERVQRPGVKIGHVMTISTNIGVLKFVWFLGASLDIEAARQWSLQRGQAVVYLFNSVQTEQGKYYQAHRDVAAKVSKLPPQIPWLHVLNVWEACAHREPHPYPGELSDSIIEINARTGRGLDILWPQMLRLKT